MSILVTGSAGFIGSHLTRRWVETGHRVYGLYRDTKPDIWCTLVRDIQGDVRDYPRMLEIIVNCEIDLIYHLAARSVVRNCRLDPLGCFETNVLGTATVLEAARQAGRVKGILVAESDKAYGPGPVPYREDQALVPEGIYEASKACVSHLVRSYWKNYGVPVFGIRSANVYGPGDPNKSRLIPNTIHRLLRGQNPQIVGGASEYVREYIYIDDFLDCIIHLMQAGPWGQSINIGSGETATVREIINLLCECLVGPPKKIDILPRADTFTEIPEQGLVLNQLRSFYPAFSPMLLEAGLKKTVEVERECSTS